MVESLLRQGVIDTCSFCVLKEIFQYIVSETEAEIVHKEKVGLAWLNLYITQVI